MLEATDFVQGEQVLYVPSHAKGNMDHQDCEIGIVSSSNGLVVYVKYYQIKGDGRRWPPIYKGTEPYTAQATHPRDLVKL